MDFYTPLDQDFIDSTNASRVINNNNNNNNNTKNYGIVFYENYTKDEQDDQPNENELDNLMVRINAKCLLLAITHILNVDMQIYVL